MQPTGKIAAAMLAAALFAGGVATAAAQEVRCTTVGGVQRCTDVTPPPAAMESKQQAAPTTTNVGRSGPTRYEADDLRIFGVDDRIRLLGETNYKTGQQTPMINSRRNCGQFHTSIICAD